MPPSLWQFAQLQHNASKAFSCECAASELASSVDLLYYLGHGSLNRHVFDLDGVCHVGEMISAPADVLKGAAGEVNHGAKAKAWPVIHTQAHIETVQAWQRRCMFIQHSHTLKTKQTDPKSNTHSRMNVYAQQKAVLFLLTPPLVLTHYFVLTHPSCFNSFERSYTCRHTVTNCCFFLTHVMCPLKNWTFFDICLP